MDPRPQSRHIYPNKTNRVPLMIHFHFKAVSLIKIYYFYLFLYQMFSCTAGIFIFYFVELSYLLDSFLIKLYPNFQLQQNILQAMRTNSTQAEFMLSIYTVKLTVKFPCRMSLHYDGKPITTEVQSNSNVFTFNQDITIKIDPKNQVEVSAYLSTGKGGSILAGLITMSVDSLSLKSGTRFTVPLQKCIDTAAVAQIKINHAWVPQDKAPVNGTRSSAGGMFIRSSSPVHKTKMRTQNDQVETRSQFQAQVVRRTTPGVTIGSNILGKQRQSQPKRFPQRETGTVNGGLNVNRLSYKIDFNDQMQDDIRETKTIGGQGVRYRRQKDKQRMQKLASKKIADETENNLKMDILKYKMKNQELQKSVTQKTRSIKELKDQLLEQERKNIQKAYIQEQLSSKQNQIKIMEDRMSNLNSENMSLRESIAEYLKSISEMKQNIRFDILKNKEEYNKKQQTLRVELNDLKAKITQLEADANNKQNQLLKAKKYIQDLQSAAEQKIFEHDRLIQDIKKEHSSNMKQLSRKISEYELKIEEIHRELNERGNSISKLQETILKLQQNTHNLEQKNQTLQIEKHELEAFKSDFQNLTKKYNKLEQSYRQEQKNHKKIIDGKNKQIVDLQDINSKNMKNVQAKLFTSNEKSKQYKVRIQELQNLLGQAKSEEEKTRKSLDRAQKINQQLATKQNQLEKQLRSYELKYQVLQKQIGEKSNNSSHIESLLRIQLQHSKESVIVLTRENDELSVKHSQAKQSSELLRNEKTKLQNKIQLLQDNITRNTQYIKQKRAEQQAKQFQYKEQVKQLLGKIKTLEDIEKNKNKEINGWEIKELTSKNKIDKLEKILQQANNKIDKLQKKIIPKLTEQKTKITQELQLTKSKLMETAQENKFITNERIKLQSETNKNNKINTVLNQQKIATINELNKMKNTIQKQQKNEQRLNSQLNLANEENKKLTLKMENLEKQLIKNKEMLNETMNSIISLKRGMKDSISLGFDNPQPSSNSKNRIPEGGQSLRKKESYIDNLANSRVMGSLQSGSYSQQVDIRRISQILQSNSKEQQNTILMQQQTINHYKDTIEKLQKQLATLSFTSKAEQNKWQEALDHLNNQLQNAHQKMLTITNNYEDKISKLETEINKKEKDNKSSKSNIGSLKYELQTLKKKLQILGEEAEIKQHKSGQKLSELVSQCSFLQTSLKNLQNQKRSLQNRLYSTQQDLGLQREQRTKKQKHINELSQKLTILRIEHEQTNKQKKQYLQQLMSLREEIQSLRELNEKTEEHLKSQQKNNKKLQQFINDLIKQKENIVKIQLQSSSKAIEMEGSVLQMKNLLDNKEEQLKQKQQQNSQYKSTIKSLQNDIKNNEQQIKEQLLKINNLNVKIEERDKKIVEKDNEIKQSKTAHNNATNRSKQEIRTLKEQYEQLQKKLQNVEEQKDNKIFNLQKHIIQLDSQIQSLNNQLIQKQELIFFEKQRASLSESTINDMKKGQSQISLITNKYENQIHELNMELTNKEQLLYEYSGKIYQLEQKLQAKEDEILIREQKVDIDWQCRHDEICQEYEQKIEVLQKDKKYLKDKLTLIEQQKSKLASEKQKHSEQSEKDIQVFKSKEKQLQEQKLQYINQKNKQIENYKNQMTALNNQIKNSAIEMKKKQNQIANKDEVIKKLEIKIHENDRGSSTIKNQYEQQINNMKKNQNVIKQLRQEIKNAQWVTEREVKKITQIFIQRVVNCFPEAKEKLVEPIRAMESSMSTAINFKI